MTTILIIFLAGYLLWVAAYLLYERHERRKRQRESEETLPRKVADAEDILGKSTFSLCHSTPQVPEKTETVKPEDEADTFAAESERYPKVVSADELDALFAEMEALETPGAKLYKAIDRIEAVIQHNEAPLDTWIELERTLNLEYGVKDCANFPFMAELRELAADDTRKKLADAE